MDGQRLDPRQLAAALPEPRQVTTYGARPFRPAFWKIVPPVMLAALLGFVVFSGAWWLLLLGLVAGGIWMLATAWGEAPVDSNQVLADHEIYTKLLGVDQVEDERAAKVLDPGDHACLSAAWKAAHREGADPTYGFDFSDLFASSPAGRQSYKEPSTFNLVLAIKPTKYGDHITIGMHSGSIREYRAEDPFQRKRAKPLAVEERHWNIAAALADLMEVLASRLDGPGVAGYLRSHHTTDALDRAIRIILAAKFAERNTLGASASASDVVTSMLRSSESASIRAIIRPTELGELWLEADRTVRNEAARDVVLKWLHAENKTAGVPARVEDFPHYKRVVGRHFLSYKDVVTATRSLQREGFIECATLDPLHGLRAWLTARGVDSIRQEGSQTEYL